MFKFIKFTLVGILNTLIDFVVLNILLITFGVGTYGRRYLVFKSLSFLVAVINSFFFNKHWVFEHTRYFNKKELISFLIVSGIGLVINVSISFIVFHQINGLYGIGGHLAANFGALAGTISVLLWNFFGYKLVVFKK